jgi:hypothetical protein
VDLARDSYIHFSALGFIIGMSNLVEELNDIRIDLRL